MKVACGLLGMIAHAGTFVSVWWFAGWWPMGISLGLNLIAGFFYALMGRLR